MTPAPDRSESDREAIYRVVQGANAVVIVPTGGDLTLRDAFRLAIGLAGWVPAPALSYGEWRVLSPGLS